MNDKISELWSALKAECCQKPSEAKTIVFLSEEKFRKAIAPLLDSDSQAAEASAKLNATTAAIEWERDRTSERKGLNPADFDALVAKFTALSNNAATAMRDQCVNRVREYLRHAKGIDIAPLINDLESLTLDQVKPGEM